MKINLIDSILSEVKKDLANQNTPPQVSSDKNRKTITVTYDFDHGAIKKVKIIAPRTKWFEFFNDYDPEEIIFDTI